MRLCAIVRGMVICGLLMTSASQAAACDMMGASFNKQVDFGGMLAKFRELSGRNQDGWGVAFYGDPSVTIFKEPIPVGKSKLAESLIDSGAVKSKILITHLRDASIGRPSPRNTHPWTRELNGKAYALAHVGGADKRLWKTATLGRFQPVGENCAEYLFCHILGRIDEFEIAGRDEAAFARLHAVLSKVNDVQTTSHLLSDGTYLFAYSSKRGTWLSYVDRKMPAAVDNEGKEGEIEETATGFVIARNGHNLAEPGEKWTKIRPGQLAVFKDGKLIYASGE